MMNFERRINGYDICSGDPGIPIDLVKLMQLQGSFKKMSMGEEFVKRVPPTPEIEEKHMRLQDINQASLHFEKFRNPVRNALQAIVSSVFEKYNLPLEGGIDIGCGATGEMVEKLLPTDAGQRATWTQIDVNPSAVAENKRRHPLSNIQPGSYLNIGVTDYYPIITGLSSLDSTAFVERAVQQVRDALKKGGIFLHIQDVKPGWAAPFQEVVSMGEKFPYVVEVVPNDDESKAEEHEVFPHNIHMYHTGIGPLSVIDLFRSHLAKAIKNTEGLILLESDWVTAIGKVDDSSNACFYSSGFNCGSSNPSVQVASTVVTVAIKKSF